MSFSEMEAYDVIVIGGGPAGLSAGIYAERYGLKTLVIAADIGGQMATADLVQNWPGFLEISGIELMNKLYEHAKLVGCKIILEPVKKIQKPQKSGDNYIIKTDNSEYLAKAVIAASGQSRRKLNVPGEEEFAGKGVSYCATCDGAFFRNKIVAVVGGGDAAAKAAYLLSKNAKKVYMFVRGDKMRAEPANIQHITNNPKVEIMMNTEIASIVGEKKVEKVVLKNGSKIALDGVFIEIGGTPNSWLFEDIGVKTDNAKNIIVTERMETNLPGFFAAGDVTNFLVDFRQGIVSSAMGAIAAHSAVNFLKHR